jgi:hypothetical protein
MRAQTAGEGGGLIGAMAEVWDRVIASDPGLARARMGLSAGVAITATLATEYGYAKAIGDSSQNILIAMLLGSVLAMIAALGLSGTAPWPKVRTAAFFPVAFAAGMLPGALVAGHQDLMLTVFVAVIFFAVWARRFGPSFFNYGFMAWMGYFMAAFLDARLSAVPGMLADLLVATALALLLSLTLLRPHPERTLNRVRRAFGARARAVARSCADLLEASAAHDQRGIRHARRRLHANGLRLSEAALILDAWLAEPAALPPTWSAAALRRRVLEAQLTIDDLAHAAEKLSAHGGDDLLPSARIAGNLARREFQAAREAAQSLLEAEPRTQAGSGTSAAPELAHAALDFAALAASASTWNPAPAEPEDAAFAPAATFILGALPGSGSVAVDVPARGGRWNPLSRTRLTTRQAVQAALAAALAIVLGRQISETRYYWAVIATFVTFAGTATRSETTLKATNRVLGTLFGLGAGIGLAELTAGHVLPALIVIVGCMMCGFYVVTVSYAGMIFFVTIMVSQLYAVLHEFTPGLLVLRLEETALGAAIGIIVGLVILPTSTRDTVEAAERAFLDSVAHVLSATEPASTSPSSPSLTSPLPSAPAPASSTDSAANVRVMEDRLRRLTLTARPLTRPLSGTDPARMRRRLAMHASLARRARTLATRPRPAVPATRPSPVQEDAQPVRIRPCGGLS